IHNGRFHSQLIPLPIEDITGRLTLKDGLIRVEEIGAKAGTGTLRLDGSLPLHLISNALPLPAAGANQPARFTATLDKLELSGGSSDQTIRATFGAKIVGEASALSLPALRSTIELTEL